MAIETTIADECCFITETNITEKNLDSDVTSQEPIYKIVL